jgi:hypothetical protein
MCCIIITTTLTTTITTIITTITTICMRADSDVLVFSDDTTAVYRLSLALEVLYNTSIDNYFNSVFFA